MASVVLTPDTPQYPAGLRAALGDAALTALGDAALLGRRTLALLCSVRCPGEVILGAYDLALALRQAGVAVVGGFHAPMERECLRILLRGTQPVVACPARGVAGMRVPAEWKGPIEQGRLLVVSPFAAGERRPTTELAQERNRFVAALADALFVAHAASGGKTEALCREVAAWGKPLLTLAGEQNANVVALGARAVRPGDVAAWWADVAGR